MKIACQTEPNIVPFFRAGYSKPVAWGLNEKKLKGEFALVKLKTDEKGNAWLLIKHRDKYAKETDVTKKDKSVVSNKTLAQITRTSKNVYGK